MTAVICYNENITLYSLCNWHTIKLNVFYKKLQNAEHSNGFQKIVLDVSDCGANLLCCGLQKIWKTFSGDFNQGCDYFLLCKLNFWINLGIFESKYT